MRNNSFKKAERLCSRKEIDLLFAGGLSCASAPLKLVYMLRSDDQPAPSRIMFVVPKRSFRRAHDRNRIRRRMREAFRLNKAALYEELGVKGKKVSSALLYTGRQEEDYGVIERSVKEILRKLAAKLG